MNEPVMTPFGDLVDKVREGVKHVAFMNDYSLPGHYGKFVAGFRNEDRHVWVEWNHEMPFRVSSTLGGEPWYTSFNRFDVVDRIIKRLKGEDSMTEQRQMSEDEVPTTTLRLKRAELTERFSAALDRIRKELISALKEKDYGRIWEMVREIDVVLYEDKRSEYVGKLLKDLSNVEDQLRTKTETIRVLEKQRDHSYQKAGDYAAAAKGLLNAMAEQKFQEKTKQVEAARVQLENLIKKDGSS